MKIDFYILTTTKKQIAMLFACSLIEKTYQAKQKAYIHLPTQEEAVRMDALLWTYRDNSFLPHMLFDAANPSPPPIQIGYTEELHLETQQMQLFNLSSTIPVFYQQFHHLIEIVFADPIVQQSARERYKQYRDLGHALNTIKISDPL
ncbi:MAG: DNA polymerase III subunit chi [Gammaproteobacteria bacterium]|nr:DNA polymerase III subunit chi [Gammaproteobacteria bacterium]